METYILKIIEHGLILIGLGILLHYYAYAIAWGIAKGWAKVTHHTQMIWKTPESK